MPNTLVVRALLFLCLLTGLFLAVGAPRADAGQTRLFLETFGSAEQPTFTRVIALAIDQGSGSVLVYDGAAGTVSRFSADGTPNNFSSLGTNVISGLETAGSDGGAGYGYPGEVGLAVDDSGTATDGNIYVAQGMQTHDVKIFSENGASLGQLTAAGSPFAGDLSPCGVAVGPGGELYVGEGASDGTINKYVPSGAVPVNSDYVASESFPADRPCNLALGAGPSAGSIFSVYVTGLATKYDLSTGSLDYQFGTTTQAGGAQTLTVDPTNGHVLLSEPKAAANATEYDVSGSAPLKIASFNGIFSALAVEAATGRVLAAKGTGGNLEIYSQIVPLPDVVTGVAAPLSPTSLQLNGTVNPVGAPVTECFFEYGLTNAYGATAPCVSPSAAELGTGNEPIAVHANVAGLAAESTYHFRLVAKNANGEVVGKDSLTKTPSKPVVGFQWASDVGTAEATVNANITPENSATTFFVEWGETAAYGNTTPSEPIAEADLEAHLASAQLTGLQAGTVYHFRFVAQNAQGSDTGVDRTFTTFKAGEVPSPCANEALRSQASLALPECRAYELVSPVDKASGDVLPLKNISGFGLKLARVAPDGDSLAYSAFRAFPGSVAAPFTAEYIAKRGASGWSSEALAPAQEAFGPFNSITSANNNFKAFTPDLCNVWFVRGAPPALAPGAVPDFGNLYRRNSCGSAPTFEALTTVTPPNFVPHEIQLEELPELLGYANDGSSTVFRLPWKLTAEGTESIEGKPAYQTYEVRNGVLKFVCILPSGNPVKENCTAGSGPSATSAGPGEFMNLGSSLSHAVSEDGSRIYWSATGSARWGYTGKIYVRVDGTSTFAVSVPQSSEPSRFLGASSDGATALFQVMDGIKEGNLYKYSLATKTSALIAGDVDGVVGTSENLDYVYFVSREALGSPGEEGVEGEPNLYLSHGGTTSLIATLADKDVASLDKDEVPNNTASMPIYHAAKASPDGRHLVFISTNPLTGEDNIDGASGEPVSEVFRFAADAGELACVSCSPAGNASGRFVPTPGSAGVALLQTSGALPVAQNQLYTPRAMADDGSHVFFTGYARLLPADRNDKADIYEWLEVGQAGCTATSTAYSPVNEGCLYLISSGQSVEDVDFIDSSPSGRDVFFATDVSLVNRDPGAIDIYTARIGGGFFEPPPPTPCDPSQGGCQSSSPPPGTTAPGSTVPTEGNPLAKKPPCPKGKHKVKRNGKVKCVKNKKQGKQKNGKSKNGKKHKAQGAGR